MEYVTMAQCTHELVPIPETFGFIFISLQHVGAFRCHIDYLVKFVLLCSIIERIDQYRA